MYLNLNPYLNGKDETVYVFFHIIIIRVALTLI